MLKSKLKEIGKKALVWGFYLFEGSGIRKVPGVYRIFSYLSSVFGGIAMIVDGLEMHTIITPRKDVLMYWEGYESHVVSLFCSLLRKGMTVVDIGASLGYYTLLAAKRVGENGLVYAFEPNPYRFEGLLKNIKVNNWKNVKPFQFAVSDFEREIKIEGGGSFAIKSTSYSFTVNTVSLDSLQTDPDIIKIDVEGAELNVLRGMGRILEKGNAKIICEVHPSSLLSLGYSTTDILDLLKQYNYNIYLISESGGLTPVTIFSNKRKHYLFTKEKME